MFEGGLENAHRLLADSQTQVFVLVNGLHSIVSSNIITALWSVKISNSDGFKISFIVIFVRNIRNHKIKNSVFSGRKLI